MAFVESIFFMLIQKILIFFILILRIYFGIFLRWFIAYIFNSWNARCHFFFILCMSILFCFKWSNDIVLFEFYLWFVSFSVFMSLVTFSDCVLLTLIHTVIIVMLLFCVIFPGEGDLWFSLDFVWGFLFYMWNIYLPR